MARLRISFLIAGPLLFLQFAVAQSWTPVDWPQLANPAAQQFEDPYRDLTPSQFQSLMSLARLQVALGAANPEVDQAELESRASQLSGELQEQGLDPQWILSQREVVAERRQQAAVSTNAALEDQPVEMTGYLLVAPDVEGLKVAYLLPNRGVCMHLPPPAPNQLIRLDIEKLPEPLGACIATAVRGRLSTEENRATVPVFDDTVALWGRWRMAVSEAVTSGGFTSEQDTP